MSDEKKKKKLKNRPQPGVCISARVSKEVKKYINEEYGNLGYFLDQVLNDKKSQVKRYGKDTPQTEFILPSFSGVGKKGKDKRKRR